MSHSTSKPPVIRVRFFAHLKTLIGTEALSVPVPDHFSVNGLMTQLQHDFPALQAAMQTGKVVISVNQEVAHETELLHDGDEVALLPPFSGGAAPPGLLADHVRIQTEDFDVAHEIRKVKQASQRIGAVVTFLGTARDFSQGRSVYRIVFEHYPKMAEKRLAEIRAQTLSEHDIIEVTLIHRVGEIPIGDPIVLIVVGAQHRKEAFEACAWCIDTLKKITPIWKKETTSEGEIWVEHP
jgi:molybdopterin synthase catalytic subunit